jgi:hypothetical protein
MAVPTVSSGAKNHQVAIELLFGCFSFFKVAGVIQE